MQYQADELFTEADQKLIVSAVREAEKLTSGEIRLFVEEVCKGNPMDRAAFIFEMLKMNQTALRNGVLFYVATHSRKFVILGDLGINQKVPQGFWDQIKEIITMHFKKDQYVDGLTAGIHMAGHALKEYFPYTGGDKNELPDDIIFGKKD